MMRAPLCTGIPDGSQRCHTESRFKGSCNFLMPRTLHQRLQDYYTASFCSKGAACPKCIVFGLKCIGGG